MKANRFMYTISNIMYSDRHKSVKTMLLLYEYLNLDRDNRKEFIAGLTKLGYIDIARLLVYIRNESKKGRKKHE